MSQAHGLNNPGVTVICNSSKNWARQHCHVKNSSKLKYLNFKTHCHWQRCHCITKYDQTVLHYQSSVTLIKEDKLFLQKTKVSRRPKSWTFFLFPSIMVLLPFVTFGKTYLERLENTNPFSHINYVILSSTFIINPAIKVKCLCNSSTILSLQYKFYTIYLVSWAWTWQVKIVGANCSM